MGYQRSYLNTRKWLNSLISLKFVINIPVILAALLFAGEKYNALYIEKLTEANAYWANK